MSASLVFVGFLILADKPLEAQSAVTFDQSMLEIHTDKGIYEFNVELAISPQQKAYGLMYRQEMGADQGMLFHYAIPQIASMWMKNTYIPLDMVFIRHDGVIENIIQRTIPHNEEVLSATDKVRGVLELNAGVTSRLGIKAGDRVVHDIFVNLAN